MDTNVTADPETSAPSLEVATVETHVDGSAASSPAGGSDVSPPSPAVDEKAEFLSTLAKARGEEPAETVETTEPPETPAQEVPEATEQPEVKTDALSHESEKPFTERPEWQALTKLGDRLGKAEGVEVRKTLRTLMERETSLAKFNQEARPRLEAVDEMIALAGGTQEGFNGMRHFFKSFHNDPAGAVPLLERLIADAKQRAGITLQSPDLLTEAQVLDRQVNDGEITRDQAERRRKELTELETTRAALKRTTQATEAERRQATERQQSERQQAMEQEIDQAESSWTAAKSKADPDFVKPFFDRAAKLGAVEFQAAHGRYPTAAEAKQILEGAYTTAKKDLMATLPRRGAREPLRDTGTSRNTRREPVTEREQFQAALEEARKRN